MVSFSFLTSFSQPHASMWGSLCVVGVLLSSSFTEVVAQAPEPPRAEAVPLATVVPTKRPQLDLDPEVRDRLLDYLPRTTARLLSGGNLKVVVLGDSSIAGDGRIPSATTYFLNEVAERFYYTGGVRAINDAKVDPNQGPAGPAIYIRDMARAGSASNEAVSHLVRGALAGEPDLMILCYGEGDRAAGVPYDAYREHLMHAALEVNQLGIDLILVGPPVVGSAPIRETMARSRGYASAALEVAEVTRSPFVDLGDLSDMVSPYVLGEDPQEFVDRSIEEIASSFSDNLDEGELRWRNKVLGKILFRALMGETERPLTVESARTFLDTERNLVVEYMLRNNSKELLRAVISALPVREGVIPTEEARRFDVGPGEASFQRFLYDWEDAGPNPYPANEPVMRSPFVVGYEKGVILGAARAKLVPLGVDFERALQVNVGNEFKIGGAVANRIDKAFIGKYEARWDGAFLEGEMELPARGRGPFELVLPLEHEEETFRVVAPLQFSVRGGGQNFAFERNLELTRNLGLGDRVRLHSVETFAKDFTAGGLFSSDEDAGIIFRTDADPNALYLVYDLEGLDIVGSPEAPGVRISVFIDARPYGKRQGAGAIQELKIFFPDGSDGVGVCGDLPIGVFGDSYVQLLPGDGVKAEMTTRPTTGGRRITVTIPRNYFYRHEWALGNGNSQIGIDTKLSLLRLDADGANPTYPDSLRYSLLSPGRYSGDPRTLTTVEFDRPSTGRWSIRLK